MTNSATEISLSEAKEMYGDDAEVEVGYQIEFPKRTDVLGRIAAQTAKQVIFQKVREAEREIIFAEYNQRVGEVMNGIVKRFEQGDIIVEVGRVEAILPRKEQSRAESYTQGDRLRAVIKGVSKSAKGPQIVLSRTDPALLIKLFEQEVPEIYDGTVMIRGAVREAGDRAKVAVYSRERDVDPVGACVGMKGTRVQAIIRELRGEKIDIVEWSDDPVAFVTNALSPAKVQRVTIVERSGQGHGGRGRGQAVVAGHRQEGPERPAGRQADRLADRHQERRREAQGSRGAARRARDAGGRADAPRRAPRRVADGRRRGARRPTLSVVETPTADESRRDAGASRRGADELADRRIATKETRLATVRIYKVAELLNTTSQEVLQLLKQNHGIELKSASSTLEEIVARQFVERLARQRGIELPKGDIFSETAVKRSRRRWPRAARRAPPRPSRPSRPRRRCRRRA